MKKLFALLAALAAGIAFASAGPGQQALTANEALRSMGLATTPHSAPLAEPNLSCGIAPIPPVGCKVGACVCDQNGRNCRWTFICN